MMLFKRAVENSVKLSPDSFEKLNAVTSIKQFKQDDFILKQDAVCKHLYFLNKGLVRIYYLKEGRDITEWFASDEEFFFSIISYFNEVPSKLIIQCIEDCEILYLPKTKFEQLAKDNLQIGEFYRLMLAGSLIGSQLRMESIQFETALQRYQGLIKNNPEIVRRAPLKYIASFLGISFETLSRIRNQVH